MGNLPVLDWEDIESRRPPVIQLNRVDRPLSVFGFWMQHDGDGKLELLPFNL